MNYLSSLLAGIAVLLSFSGFAQSYEQYNWAEEPEMSVLEATDTKLPEIKILRHVQYEYVYEEKSSPTIFFTRHEITRVNNDDGVASNNRIYIPMQGVIELVEVRARTIHPDGRVIEIKQSDIKEIEDEEEGAGYRIFAIDGAEVGSEIEFYYTCKKGARFFGREYFQSESPLKKASFKLIAPANLEFEFKSYNGLAEVQDQESTEEKNIYQAVDNEVPSLKPAPFSAYNSHRKRVEFKLAYNKVNGYVKLFSWENAGKNVYEQMHRLDRKEEKQLAKIMKEIKPDRYENNYLKAAAIEHHVKTRYYINENASGADNITFIGKNKSGSKFGLSRLMVSLLEKAGIPVELVITNERGDVKMDGDFESYNYLAEYLIYLPEEDKYIAPYHFQNRLDMTPAEFTANWGLFVKTMVVRDFAYPVSEIKYIAAPGAIENHDNMLIAVEFNEDLSSNTIQLTRSFKGYQASGIKSVMPLLEEAKRQELLKELVKFMSQDSEIEEMAFEKTDFDFSTFSDPLVVNSKFKSSAFVERAGPTLLLKVGELIGPQSELYQEEERTLPVENSFNRSYLRNISVTIPEGYEIQNLQDLVLNENANNEEGETVYSFVSSYKLEGNKLTVEVTEFYDKIYYPVEKFEDFRKVINAAADFNKIVLVMKKKVKG